MTLYVCHQTESVSLTLICIAHRPIYKYLDTGLPSVIVAKNDPVKLTSPALTHARQPNLSSIYRSVASCGIGLDARKFQNEITLGRRAHVRKMFVSLTHSPHSAYNIHICNKV